MPDSFIADPSIELRRLRQRLAAAEEREAILRRQADADRRQTESLLRLVWEKSADGMRLTDEAGTILMANGAFCRMVGKPRDEVEGRSMGECYARARRSAMTRRHGERFSTRTARPQFETEVELWDGRRRWFDVSSAFLDVPGRPPLVLSVFRDVTDRRLADAALRESERRFRETLETARLVAVWLDLDGRVTFCNDAVLAVTGYDRSEVVGQNWFDLFVPAAERPALKERFARNARRGELVTHFESEILTRTGEARVIAWNNTPLRGPGGDPVGTSSVGEDVTERHRAEVALRASEARFRAFMEHTPAVAWITDSDGRLAYVNAAFGRTIRLPPGDPVGRSQHELFPEEFAREYLANIRAAADLGTVIEAEEPVVRADGSLGRFLVYKFLLPDEAGWGLVGGVAVDITERSRAEAALRQSEERYRELFESSPLAMWIYDAETLSFLAVNAAATRLYGYSREEFLGLTIKDVRPPEDVPALLATLPVAAPRHGTYRHRTKDGRLLDVEVSAHTTRFDGRDARCVVVADVTEHRRLEEQLRQAHKMEAVGRLAGGVAHDFNNLLTAILGFTEVLLDGLPAGDDRRLAAEEVRKAGERAADLTRQLLAFGRRQILQARVLDLNAVTADMENILRRVIGEDVTLITDPAPVPLPVLADAGELERVILNLAVNARDAMPNGGRLTIATSALTVSAADLRDHHDLRPGEFAVLSVSDTGVGMDEAVRARIFEPFFTTKSVGAGTGLGLATVYGVVKQSGGDVTVRTAPGRGTTFTVYLPKAPRPSDADRPAPPAAPAATGRETVLVVEDEDAVRDLVRLVLARQGYRVIEAADGAAAVAAAANHEGPIHLLVSDVVMPGVCGPDLAAQLTAIRPDLRVLFLSGYAEDEAWRRGVRNGTAAFLHKPFLPAALAAAVRGALDKTVDRRHLNDRHSHE